MKKVSKLIIIDQDDKYLLMHRSTHPTFANDPDLPGGMQEEHETLLETVIREAEEEAGIKVDHNNLKEVYSGVEYSTNGTHYALFVTKVVDHPKITISWEHSTYEWLDRDVFIEKAKNAKDTYMHMVADKMRQFID